MNNNITTYVKCWKITLTNNEVIGITENITDFIYEDVLYKTNFNLNKDLDVNVVGNNATTILNIAHVLPNDIALGKLDGALIKIFFFDYSKNCEAFEINSGVLSKVNIIDGKFFFNIVPTIKTLTGVANKLYSRTCRANFCDKECGLNIANFMLEGEILYSHENKIFSKLFLDYEDNYFTGATIEINEQQYKIETHVKDYIAIKFFDKSKVENEQKFKILFSCDKEFNTCKNKYHNSLNFRGEPFLRNYD